jgi:TolB-like protein/pimeloyl-ACP methyl ester carboxylesterase/Flp pilus assembly protein TadD
MEYFSDGITESLINALSQLPKLRVVARSTVFRYKSPQINPREIGQQLGVRAVLTGRVRQTADGLMIAAELIDVTNDSQLWGERYTRELSDIFAVQEEIAKVITEKLRIKLTGDDKRRLAKRFTENPAAYHAYLKGRYYWNKRATAELRKGVEHFRQAIDLDPSYASAYAGVSDSYTLLVVREAIPPDEGFAKAKAAAEMALKIDRDLSEAHASLGHALLHNWEWEAAEQELKRAIALNPGYPSAHHWYSEHLTAMGRFDESLKELRLAGELDPLSLIINADLGRAFYFAREYDQTIKQENKTLEMDSHFWLSHINLGRSFTQKKMFAEAISELQIASELSPGNTEALSYLGFAYAAAGERDKALQTLEDLERQAQQGYVPPYHLAIIHTGLNQKDQAFEWLERAYEAHAVDFFTLNVEPMFDQLRSDPRFTDIVRRIGLAPSKDEPTSARAETSELADTTSPTIPLEQEIRFCTTADGVRIAYATVGYGPPMVKAANWLNHLEFDWKSPIWRHVVEEFARDHLLVRYDERGNGLSDWDVKNFTFEAFVQDLETVVDSLRLDRFPILGISQGGPVAIAYAVRHPEKVSHLILYGSYARGWAKRGIPEDVERREAQNKLIKLGWGQDNPAFRQLWSTQYVPDGTLEQWKWFNDLHRISTSPDNAIRLEHALGQIDVVDLLSQVKVPTLVLNCRDELQVPFEEGRLLAAKIPGARFVPLEGRNHLLLEHEPAWAKFVTEVRRFLETERFEAKPQWSQSPDSIDRTKSGGQTTVETANVQGIRTGEVAPAPLISNAEISPVPAISSAEYIAGAIKRHKILLATIGAIVLLLIAGLVYSSFWRVGRTIDSLAVLPFLNVSGDPNTEYLSDGIAESIIYSTSQLPDLKVMPRSSVVRYRGKEVDPQTVGRELGVSAVMTGRVIQRGDDLSISAELIDLRDNRVLWGKQYNRKLGDILAVQEEIARESSEKLRRLTTEEKKQLSKRYTQNSEAYQLYLKGRYYWNKRSTDGYQKGIDHFQQAIEKDPNYALAWTGLADSYMLFGRFGVVPPKESMPKAKYAAMRALEIDDELAEAHTSLGYIKKEYDWDFQGAEAELKRAIQLNPNYPTGHFWYALYLAETLGKHDEALAKMDRAQELEPLSLIMSTDRGLILYLAHRYDQAIEQFRKTLDMEPDFFRAHLWLGRAYEQKGMYKEAIEEFQEARQLDDKPFVLAALGHAFAASDRRGDAQKVLDELKQLSKRMYVDSYYVAAIHVALGETDQAFQSLEKAYDDRSTWLSRIKVDPIFDSLHTDPRFTKLVQRIGLP